MADLQREKIGVVLVVGGGIAGMQAALDVAAAGLPVTLVEEGPAIGGLMAQLDKTFPTNDCAMCILSPRMLEVARHPLIEILTLTRLTNLSGEAGDFTAHLSRRPRYVDVDKCSGCGECTRVCPARLPDPYNLGLSRAKAIHVPFPQAVPQAAYLEPEACRVFRGKPCEACLKVCPAGAIDLHQTEEVLVRRVGAVILAPGSRPFDARGKAEYGYGRYPNVVTSPEFERLLSATGPCAGHVRRPSDGTEPRRIAWIQCVGSRDASLGREYCSYVCCMYAAKQAIIAREHDPRVEPTIFFIDFRAQGKGFDRYYERARETHGVRFLRSMVSRVTQDPRTHNLEITYVGEDGDLHTEEFDLVVLSVGLGPHPAAAKLAEVCGIETDKYGFVKHPPFQMVSTSREGIFTCGAYQSPKDISETAGQASAAAAAAAALLAEAQTGLLPKAEYPPEREVSQEEPRLGVFICHCGINIAGVVDVVAVTDYARTLPHVVHAEHYTFACATDSLDKMRAVIEEQQLNRVVVASCSPRTHEPLFQENLRKSGLNKYLLEMANIRDQDSWVHQNNPAGATEKAKELVKMAAARAAELEPLKEFPVPVTQSALVVGNGLAALTAALTIADAGYQVHLAALEDRVAFGGLARKQHYSLEGHQYRPYIEHLAARAEGHPRIRWWPNSRVTSFSGYVGNFRSTLEYPGESRELRYGVAIIATGGVEYQPREYLYGRHPRVLTQMELENRLTTEPERNTLTAAGCAAAKLSKTP